jgi:hypothetical protein
VAQQQKKQDEDGQRNEAERKRKEASRDEGLGLSQSQLRAPKIIKKPVNVGFFLFFSLPAFFRV